MVHVRRPRVSARWRAAGAGGGRRAGSRTHFGGAASKSQWLQTFSERPLDAWDAGTELLHAVCGALLVGPGCVEQLAQQLWGADGVFTHTHPGGEAAVGCTQALIVARNEDVERSDAAFFNQNNAYV